ncbi:helix-turn-helix transcriptional regulator [Sphingomonas lacusdianchii]|uniref:helix-turn-helix transcriptional regulator n=1 Tax=Sphingomonas lacusdianchii TaxID=2917992 RepID=UPI001F59358F|nr:hypothetical protein [Sphingomonas sp. JXJ CY 53]
MKMHEFTIIANGLDPRSEDFEARFYNAGCDDALVSFQKGHILIDFSREAESLEDAIASAIENVRGAGANVERVEPDPLVSLAEIAARSQMTRAAITNYHKGDRGSGFPAAKARVTTSSPLWDWADVSAWLYRNDRLPYEAAVGATVVSVANDLIECGESNFRDALHEKVQERVLVIG